MTNPWSDTLYCYKFTCIPMIDARSVAPSCRAFRDVRVLKTNLSGTAIGFGLSIGI